MYCTQIRVDAEVNDEEVTRVASDATKVRPLEQCRPPVILLACALIRPITPHGAFSSYYPSNLASWLFPPLLTGRRFGARQA